MTAIHRKRALEKDETETRAKIPRHTVRKKIGTDNETGKLLSSDIQHDERNIKLSSNATSVDTTNNVSNFARVDRAMPKPHCSTMECTSSKPFTYQPLDKYLKAEALRLLFIKHGLHHKQPRSDIQLLSEEHLAPFVQQWEECFEHWYPLMGQNAMQKTECYKNDCSHLPGPPLFGLKGTNPHIQPRSDANLFASGATDCESSEFVVGGYGSNAIGPSFKPFAANCDNSRSVEEQLRCIVKSEVKKHLDGFHTRSVDSDNLPRYNSLSNDTSSGCLRPDPPTNSQPCIVPSTSAADQDTLIKLPKMIPVRRLADGTFEYLDDDEFAEKDSVFLPHELNSNSQV